MKHLKRRKKYFSAGEYLEFERKAVDKHEYFDGEIFAMAGSTFEHAVIVTNISTSLNFQLKKRRCTTSSADLRVHVPATGLYTYPDVITVCSEPQFLADTYLDTLLNPDLIVEVLSTSTADYDMGAKFESYRTIDSLREYVLVWQDKKRVARYTKRDDGSWILHDFIGDDVKIDLISVECTLTMDDIYDKVEFAPSAGTSGETGEIQ